MEYQDIVANIKKGVIKTPAYIFDTDILRRKIAMITEILGSTAQMCYAIKANPFLINAMDDMVPKYEVCSPGELEICRNCGISMEKVVFSGINKTADSVRIAARYGVGVMTVESMHQFDLIAQCAAYTRQTIRVLLRLTNGSQFGINEQDIETLIASRKEYPFVRILGVQYFTGTQKKKCSHILEELDYCERFCAGLKEKYQYDMEQFEYGTGLWVPYFTKDNFENEFSDLIQIQQYFAAKNYPYQIILEMGRYPVASCGYFATKAEDCKTNKNDNFCIIDAGIHQINYYGQNMALKTPLIDHYPMHPQANVEPQKWMLCGSLCTFNDVVARNLPVQDLQIGDYFVFHHIGAYAVTEGGYLFLSRDLPNIYFADNKNGIRLVRKGIPSHIINTPDFTGERLDTPMAPIPKLMPKNEPENRGAVPSAAVRMEQEKTEQSPRLSVPGRPDDGIEVIGMNKNETSVKLTANEATGKAASVSTNASRKRFVPETDVVAEARRDKENASLNTNTRSTVSRNTASARTSGTGKVSSPASASRKTSSGSSRKSSSARGNNSASRSSSSDSVRRSHKKKQSRSKTPIILAVAAVLMIAGISLGMYFGRRVLPTLEVEAGTSITKADVLRYKSDKEKNNKYSMPHVDTSTPGEYAIEVYLSPFTYHSTVVVKDTTAPEASVKDVTAWYGASITPEDFINEVNDATAVDIEFASKPDMLTCGEQSVTLILTDAAGNKTEKAAKLTVSGTKAGMEIGLGEELPDASAFLADEFLAMLAEQGVSTESICFAQEPAIDTTVPGDYAVSIQAGDQILTTSVSIYDTEAPTVYADDIHIIVGDTIAYKKAIRAYDNVDSAEDLTIEVIRDSVDANTEGDYSYTATVTDQSGNSASATGTIHVLPAGSEVADIDEVNAMADAILEEILEDGMTEKEKLKAIYNWIRSNTRYSGHAQEEDYTLGAYQGFTEHAGDCFTYAAQAKFLLTRAGIENIDVVKVVPEGSTDIPTHFWNLVNIGEGWYHYDVTPRKDGSTFFYITNAELKEYSASHNGTHAFDESLYPEIQ